ncbi:MAG: carbamoyl-phosphate synthase large subunit [Acidimicrobiaceae bacterium]|nr:carbamoyl-phosphate synthase large subunit [Acidimicrobiaceae bacterium]
MPRRDDIDSILVIGSGPIIIGQACEFDYSGTQACRVLRSEGYRVILANSNPATIMTDPSQAHATYVEPLDASVLKRIIRRESPDALLPTLGGQTGLNLAAELSDSGVLDDYGVELIGADFKAISTAEDRQLFKEAMIEIGLDVPRSGTATSMGQARKVLEEVGLPVIVRPAFILGGSGTGIAATLAEFEAVAEKGLETSPIGEILIEESIVGWKEFELEVMRDHSDNCVVVCSIENFDPMGVHTGDSITVAPAMTLSDPEYQQMRNAAFAVLRRVGVDTGGSNVQFAVDPATGRQVVIEMNPRVSRSSALASKATGFPIAKIAARLAVGYTLDEIPNDITGETPASFEPTIDYVVVKIPRWAFEKFPETSKVLGTSMKSVGEAMSIGRTFPEALQKGIRSLEQGHFGLNADPGEAEYDSYSVRELMAAVVEPTPERIFQIETLLRRGVDVQKVYKATGIDAWFLHQIAIIANERLVLERHRSKHRAVLRAGGVKQTSSDSADRDLNDASDDQTWVHSSNGSLGDGDGDVSGAFNGLDRFGLDRLSWRKAKRLGFADAQLAYLWDVSPEEVRAARISAGIKPTFKTVDTCAAEFAASTPYHYSTYEDTDEVCLDDRPRVIICGSGPNRIGQGIEFDYCCVHASEALREAGYATLMINCNPETVSTDYDTSDQLFFEPLTAEDVLNVIEASNPLGVIVSLGGQTPLALSEHIPDELVLGTSPAAIDLAEDRERWNVLCNHLQIPQPAGGTALNEVEALEVASRVGYPVLVRPSYVLGGRAMTIVYDDTSLTATVEDLLTFGSLSREGDLAAARPVLIDSFLGDAIEVDVDALRDHTGEVLIGAIMEHVEQAGIHSGDSACMIPPASLDTATVSLICDYTALIANELNVKGPLNVQYAVQGSEVFVIEANPRASRTMPFVAKATGVPLAKIAARLMLGETLEGLRKEKMLNGSHLAWMSDSLVVAAFGVAGNKLGMPHEQGVSMSDDHSNLQYVAVKEAVLPFNRFPDVDAALGPEMRSTGEVMALDATPGLAFVKAQLAAGTRLPGSGLVFMSMADRDKPLGLKAASILVELGYELAATTGTAAYLRHHGVPVIIETAKLADSEGLNVVDLIESDKVRLVINSPHGRGSHKDGDYIRLAVGKAGIPLLTTGSAALAAADGLRDLKLHEPMLRSLQEYHNS